MIDPKYKAFTALDPFFDIVLRGLAGHVDGHHYFDTIADDAVFEFRYIFPGWHEVHGKIIRTRAAYDNRFISVVTIGNRKIVQCRDYMDSLTAMTALSQT